MMPVPVHLYVYVGMVSGCYDDSVVGSSTTSSNFAINHTVILRRGPEKVQQ